MTDQDKRLSRRHFVGATGAATLAGLAGCSGGNGGDGSDGGDGDGSDGGDGGSGNTLEVLHAWTGGDGARAAEALVAAFEEEYPDVDHEFNPIGGGGNQNLDAVVANRLQNGDPPSSFANWPGPNLQRYEGVLGEVGGVWESEGFEDVMVDEAVDLHQYNGAYRAVPLGSHRLNCLFYNTSVVEEAGVDPDSLTSVSALIDALETVQSETDAIPMTHGASGTWTTTQLFASTMLGQEGYDAYMSFLDGSPDEAAVRATFESLAEILGNYINDDASSIGLTESNQNIIEGNAAFIHQGNWAAGAYRNAEDFNYDEDWGFKTYPGSEGMYMLHFDSFLYPSDNPSPEATEQFMAFVGSEAAQVAFNQYKGSIPTRTDVDMSQFGLYLQETQEDFASADQRPPNLQHGLGVPSETMTSLNDVISSEFSGPYDVDAATQGFVDAVSN
ncbi:ABC transporter substrate-binding protein [Halorubrum ezzemoulense]|uniref:ABC transporter substrate-binding protein n=1 Tax=Halorubrum ezzemoulense TaxID=337243 RepID=UPI00232D25F8|nr:ABC transporter substrate-binding protein [Halorubrum ezzemoulense]MDB9248909.1 ABC transporter substrate-binding protein [Halorubrum ezzemoulense]MDB9258753.1 ABC transporter substrate-binding protein [Halorubrum ezzemoulense]MDB9262668.1 ABC transporter substrate-binding protein [Halorubrum ezzemoulense]MDB9265772.1 ABC transporter substrate-binding protein [Halorubrum ezzemoulense]MDB9269114.1 ABC transporter substrate-binding protein [Halorubrum ezzemoulense]